MRTLVSDTTIVAMCAEHGKVVMPGLINEHMLATEAPSKGTLCSSRIRLGSDRPASHGHNRPPS
jgi:hypothetical protein